MFVLCEYDSDQLVASPRSKRLAQGMLCDHSERGEVTQAALTAAGCTEELEKLHRRIWLLQLLRMGMAPGQTSLLRVFPSGAPGLDAIDPS